MADKLHKGHRERLRKRYLETGLKGFSDINTLEFLLTFVNTRGDTNPLAHRLIKEGKTLKGVLDLPPNKLMAIDGVGPHTTVFLHLLRSVFKEYYLQEMHADSNLQVLNTIDKCGHYLIPSFMGYKDEVVFLLCLDDACHPVDCRELFRGSVNCVNISVRKVLEVALAHNATSVVLAHNHPCGIALPSVEDEQTTYRMKQALETVGIPLVDHIIVAGNDFVSLAQSGLFHKIPPVGGASHGF